MASCPFRRATSNVSSSNGALKRTLTSRQSSVQLTVTEEVEEEDRNTLNLKTLNAALMILTSPPALIFILQELYGILIEALGKPSHRYATPAAHAVTEANTDILKILYYLTVLTRNGDMDLVAQRRTFYV
ncbi:hypothetical protein Trydic_g20753 [Trypoxylus dichotomus]